ncbi:MAG: FHA domain-containing protein [Polyangiaceae bacterium]|nr:FHA domain-containing protein [Polyangiaceae bacterium]
MWKLSIEDDQGNKTVVHLVRDDYTIGRAEASTVRLTERNISRKHIELVREGSGWVVIDRKSYNGVHVNGVRVHEKKALAHGDVVQLGDYRMELGDETADAKDTSPQSVAQESQVDQDRLVIVAGLEVGTEFALTGERLVLGRGDECDISLNHASVSRVHAEISSLGDGRYEFIDKESANGVRINGVDLKRSILDARDTIELGDVVLKFIPAGQAYNPLLDRSLSLLYAEPAPVGPVASAPPAKPISPALKVVGALLLVTVLVGVGWVASKGSEQNATFTGIASSKQDEAARVLEEAGELLAKGAIEDAHQKVAELPESSNARQSPAFRKIESEWAKALLAQADAETDPTVKRELLKQVVLSPTVDTFSRKRAEQEIKKLTGDAVDISDLPTAPKVGANRSGAAKPPPPTSPSKLPHGGIVRENPYE